MHYRTSRATDFLTSASLIYSKKSSMSDNNVSSDVRKQQTELKRKTES